MDHIRIKVLEGVLQEIERKRPIKAAAFTAWCARRGFTPVVEPEFWLTQQRFQFGWWRATVRLPNGTTRRVYDGGGSPEGWRMGNPSKKKESTA